MIANVRTRRERNEEIGFYHVHFGDRWEDEFTEKTVICRATNKSSTDTLDNESFWDGLVGNKSEAALPTCERIRRKLRSTLLINFLLGFSVLAVSASALVYSSWSYGRTTANGLRNVLIILIVQGNSLMSASLLGLAIYKVKNSSWISHLFYTTLILLIVVSFLTVNSNLPNTETVIKNIEIELDKYQEKLGKSTNSNFIGRSWCCSVRGFKESCYSSSGMSSAKKDPSHNRLFDSIDNECFKLMGWAQAETLIKSCSCFLVPGLLLIILINSLIHYGSSSNPGFVRVCDTEYTQDEENIL
ncbi:hypothetical protein GE061_016212 [Apolygus lucorum]|uniref:Uncharacterized protein n=1 Tax=Apolygus lucorum TaxID=248454 RepID=A0A6A4JYA1_APOLU|nr:hypothetical protein GE061_016212 [Apolygus lucorum]